MSENVLVLPYPARKTARIPCVNPTCKRTAPREDDDETEIICGKCFRALPASLRERYRALGRRERRLLRLSQRRYDAGSVSTERVTVIAGLIERAHLSNWQAISRHFQHPDKPAGLDGFLREVGL
jgi:hypothetical protein